LNRRLFLGSAAIISTGCGSGSFGITVHAETGRSALKPKKIAILGSSHVYALMAGVDSTVQNIYTSKLLQDFSGMHNIVRDDDPPTLRDDVAEWIKNSLDADYLLLSISGSDWLAFCASNREPKIDIALPDHPELAQIPNARLIPLAEMRHAMTQRIRHVVRGITALRQSVAPHIPIWYICSPPPVEDNELVRGTVTFAAEIARHGVTDPVLRLKMYLLHSMIVSDTCTANGLPFILPPNETKSGQGYLALDCVGTDCFHANDQYGRYVIRDIERRLNQT